MMGDGKTYRPSQEFKDSMAQVRQQRSEEVCKALFLLSAAFQNVHPSISEQLLGITVTPELRDALLCTVDRRYIDSIFNEKEKKYYRKVCGIRLNIEEPHRG